MKVVSWDGNAINDGTNYRAGLHSPIFDLPEIDVLLGERSGRWPVVSGYGRPGRTLYLEIDIAGTSAGTLRQQLHQWFDPEDETARQLVIEDDDGTNDRYVLAVCKRLDEQRQGSAINFLATLVIDGDIRWREVTATTDTWGVTATGQTKALTNGGADEAYPLITIKPTSAKTGGYAYRRHSLVRWTQAVGAAGYFVNVTGSSFDTAALVTGGKMQADGDDLRVFVDGVEVERHLGSINTTATKVWVKLAWAGKTEAALLTAIASSGAISTITLASSPSAARWPGAGLVVVDSEAFSYTGVTYLPQQSKVQLTGVTRTIKGTSAAAHSVGATCWLLQHDVVIMYGNSSASAPTVDTNYKPAFDVDASGNSSWDYTEFGETDGLRGHPWTQHIIGIVPLPPIVAESERLFYTGDEFAADTDPWAEMGLQIKTNLPLDPFAVAWRLYNPCGISAANFQIGESYVATSPSTEWDAAIMSSATGALWVREYTIAAPGTPGVWGAWSRNETLNSGSYYVGLLLNLDAELPRTKDIRRIEVSRVTVTIADPPTLTLGSEITNNYPLDVTITNNTTGESIAVNFPGMTLNEQIRIDTDARTVTYLLDGTSQFAALTVQGTPRRDWLRLQPGSNTLQYDDTGTNGVTVTIEWEERSYF